jgi:zinc protease
MTKRPATPLTAVLGFGLVAAAIAVPATGAAPDTEIHIPFTRFVLDNGLTLIVSEDHKAPIVAVNVWYHVGSKNERPGKTGFAHLFEHLMFNGSENHNDDYFKPFDRVGATDMNGTTNFDRTNYFQNVPTTALDMALWMESDRMGHLLGAIDQERLDEQRGVVQNEKRQGENQPYGKAFLTIFENTYPKAHPYSWSVIGSMEDLGAASLEDVHQWFKDYYGPANAVIAVAGDVNTEEIKTKVETYFGDIPSGPPVTRQEAWVAKRTGVHRTSMQDRVPQSRIYKVWNTPELGSADSDYLDMVARLLASGKNSRLYKRLVYDDQVATDVSGFAWERELGGLFVLWATAQPGQDPAEMERMLDEEVRRFINEGPTRRELDRVKTEQRAEFIRGIERIGGFGGKSDILARFTVYLGDPGAYRDMLDRKEEATARDLQQAARRWLDDGEYVLEIHPFPEYTTADGTVDRSTGVPVTETFPDVPFPAIQRATLANGMQVLLAERHGVPIVQFDLQLNAGYAADQFGTPGTASLAMNMLDEGTRSRSSLEISEELGLLGAELGTGSNLDVSSVTLSALNENLDASLDIYADVILNPSFPESEFERLRKEQLARIEREQATPVSMAYRVFPLLIFGKGHAYGIPFTGSGTEASVASLTGEGLRDFHETWFRPNNAKLIVVGNTTLEEILPKLEGLFAGWTPGEVPDKKLDPVDHQPQSVVYLIDRPESIQSLIIAGHVAPPTANPDETAIEAMNGVLGSSFNARINMNLREDKHWSYGARSVFVDAKGQRPFFVYAPIQSDKTKEAMAEIRKELVGILEDNPATAEELTRVQDRETLSLPGRWETLNRVADSIAEITRFGLPDDYWVTYPGEVRALTLDDVNRAAETVIHPDNLVWVVVGDRASIEPGIRELDLGEIIRVDADGNRLEAPSDKTELRP